MKTVTVRDLRYDFPQVMKWIERGEEVEVTRRGRAIVRLSPVQKPREKKEWPDFTARLGKIFPNRPKGKPASDIVSEGRGDR